MEDIAIKISMKKIVRIFFIETITISFKSCNRKHYRCFLYRKNCNGNINANVLRIFSSRNCYNKFSYRNRYNKFSL